MEEYKLIWKKFNAMGTEIIISAFLGKKQNNLLEEAESAVFDFEKNFSRFLKGNELDKFNNLEEGVFEASGMMSDLMLNAKQFNLETSGVFEPTVIGSLESVGYDKSFTEIEKYGGEKSGKLNTEKISGDFLQSPKIKDMEMSGNKITKPKGMRIDFGGMGKGYIVDFLGDKIFNGVGNFWISAGGDLFVKGGGENGDGWKIGVQNPNDPDKEVFSINSKGKKLGVATSAVFKRKGITGNFKWHHLIDPRTGLPVENNVLAVTVIAPTAQQADVYAKTALILGEKDGVDFIESRDNSACIIFFKDKSLALSKNALNYF